MVMYNPQDGMYYDVPMNGSQPQTTNMYRNPLAGIYGQGISQQNNLANISAAPMAQPAAQQGAQLTVRPASNINEVQATMIGLGTINLFYNQRAGEIYLSRYSNDGAKEIEVFVIKPPETQANEGAASSPVAPPVDFSGVYSRLDELKTMITEGSAYEHEPVANASDVKGRGKPATADKPADSAVAVASGYKPASKANA